MAMGIEYHQNRTPHTAWVSGPWASGSWYQLHRCLSPPEDTTHGISIDCMGIGIGSMGISSMSIGNCHHRTRKRHQHHGHGYRVPPEQDATHGIGIGSIGIWFMASTAWVWYRHRFNGHYGHGHLVHGIGCMSIEDATHGISIGCIDIEYHQNRMPHTASVSVQWVSWP